MGGELPLKATKPCRVVRDRASWYEVGYEVDYSAHFFTIMLALWPPKPNVLESA